MRRVGVLKAIIRACPRGIKNGGARARELLKYPQKFKKAYLHVNVNIVYLS